MITQQQIQAIVDTIVASHNPEKIVLFGSYAYGEPNENSDLDLLVVNNSMKDNKVLQKEIRSSFLKRSFAFDVLICKPSQIDEWKNEKLSFLTQIIDKGKVMHEKKS